MLFWQALRAGWDRQSSRQPARQQSNGYKWGNYEANSGACCKMRDAATVLCASKKHACGGQAVPNLCYISKFIPKLDKENAKYAMHIRSLNKREPDPPKQIRQDHLHYKPSNKNRAFQRTWGICKMKMVMKPVKICYHEQNRYPTGPRRKFKRTVNLTPIQRHLTSMKQACITRLRPQVPCRRGRRPPDCPRGKRPRQCRPLQAPYPSFSECKPLDIPQRACPDECACTVYPSMCEAWRTFHRNHRTVKRCTEALISYCPFKPQWK